MEGKIREVVVYKDCFIAFFAAQSRKVQDKIIKILDIIEHLERIPESYLKYIVETDGLYEIRVQFGREIFRIFCFFDGDRVVVLLTGFQKKTQKTPSQEIDRALRLKREYFEEKGETIWKSKH